MPNTQDLRQSFDKNQDRFLEDWKQLLSFPSISADPGHSDDCRACADWLAKHLEDMGFAVRLLETIGKPVVFAERQGDPDKPVALFYGHYDVQPVDPLDAWETPPFEPSLRNGRLYARGAEDNKGQFLYAIKAIETLIQDDAFDLTVKWVIEGEEECGSRGISDSLPDWVDLLAADILFVTDTSTVPSNAPTIIMGLRGIIHLTAVLSGPTHDLHSGVHGGCAPNPAQEVAHLISSLHHEDGSIAVEGFYDGVTTPTDQEKELAAAEPFDPKTYQKETGVPPLAGDAQFTPVERTGFRPSIDINGVHSGYGGAGIKTIIPSRAEAKITARLVAGQDPQRCLDLIIAHLKTHAPAGLELEIPETGIGGPGFRLNPNSELAARARTVLKDISGRDAAFLWEGASIPIVADLARQSGAEPLLIGFGREEDKIHAPNESFSIEQFKLGYLYVGRMLSVLSDG